MPKWKKEISEIVCVFEKDLPTSLMVLKVHLLIHLVGDIDLEGFVSIRWMFLFARHMKTLKIYVRQKAHLEGCITEVYVLNESFFFLCEFLGKYFEYGPCFWDEE